MYSHYGPLSLTAHLIEAFPLDRCKLYAFVQNDMTNRNMLTIAIWSFLLKVETDVSKEQHVFTERVLCVYVRWSD